MTAIIIFVVWIGLIWFLLKAGKWMAKLDEDHDKIFEEYLKENEKADN